MASVRTARSDSHVVRAYAGIDPATGRAVYLSETVPADAPESAVEDAMARLDKRAKDARASPEALTVGSAVKGSSPRMRGARIPHVRAEAPRARTGCDGGCEP